MAQHYRCPSFIQANPGYTCIIPIFEWNQNQSRIFKGEFVEREIIGWMMKEESEENDFTQSTYSSIPILCNYGTLSSPEDCYIKDTNGRITQCIRNTIDGSTQTFTEMSTLVNYIKDQLEMEHGNDNDESNELFQH